MASSSSSSTSNFSGAIPLFTPTSLLKTPKPNVIVRAWRYVTSPITKKIGKAVGKLILPATKTQMEVPDNIQPGTKEYEKYEMAIEYKKDRAFFEARMQDVNDDLSKMAMECNVMTPDGVHLNAVIVKPQGLVSADKTCIIKFVGNSGYFEKPNILQEAVDEAKEKNCVFILFNYRGVGKSSPESAFKADQWVSDALTMASLAQEFGCELAKTFFKAHSLGGAISAIAADLANQAGIALKEYSSRSFALLSSVAAGQGWLRPIKRIIFKAIFSIFGFEMDPGSSYLNIPSVNRDHYCARLTREEREQNQREVNQIPDKEAKEKATLLEDTTIPYEESLHKRYIKHVRTRIEKDVANYILPEDLKVDRKQIVKEDVRAVSKKHKMTYKIPGDNAHGAPVHLLFSHTNKPGLPPLTAKHHFDSFFKRCVESVNSSSEVKLSAAEEKDCDSKSLNLN